MILPSYSLMFLDFIDSFNRSTIILSFTTFSCIPTTHLIIPKRQRIYSNTNFFPSHLHPGKWAIAHNQGKVKIFGEK